MVQMISWQVWFRHSISVPQLEPSAAAVQSLVELAGMQS
jgi:hypothetical protein